MNKENFSDNKNSHIFIKGDLDKIRLEYSGILPKIIFQQHNFSRSFRHLSVNPLKIISEGNTLACIDCINFVT